MVGKKFADIYQQLNPDQRRAVDTVDGPVMVLAGPGTGKTQVLSARIANILLKTDVNPGNVLALTFTDAAANNMQKRVVGMIGAAGYQVEIGTFHAFCNSVISSYPEYFPLARGSQALGQVERYLLFEDLVKELPLEVLRPLKAPDLYVRDLSKAISDLKRENVSVERLEELVEFAKEELDEMTSKSARQKAERLVAKQKELIIVYREYQERLQKLRRFDYEDMVGLVVQAFEHEASLLAEYQEKYQYILVDEYQDTNSAQNKVVELLGRYWGETANVFVVGDPQQSIYRFQGASLENMVGFLEQYSQAEVINLSVGYRCSQAIYDTAFGLIGGGGGKFERLKQVQSDKSGDKSQHGGVDEGFEITDPRRLRDRHARNDDRVDQVRNDDKVGRLLPSKPLQSVSGIGQSVTIVQVPSSSLELTLIAEQIQKILDEGVPAEEIAILYRTNAESLALMEVLDGFGIAYDVEGGGNVLDLEPIRQLIELLHLIIDLRDSEDESRLFEVLCYPWLGLRPVTVMKLVKSAHKARQSVLEFIDSHPGLDQVSGSVSSSWKSSKTPHPVPIKSGSGSSNRSPETLSTSGVQSTLDQSQIFSLIDQLATWATADFGQTLPELFVNILDQSGFLAWVKDQSNKVQLLLGLQALFAQIKMLARSRRGAKLADFLRVLDTLESANLAISVHDEAVTSRGIKLFTAHKAKGQEWQYVFVTGVYDKNWGNRKQKNMLPLPDGVLTNLPTQPDQLAEERRLLYVALTRAKKQVLVSYSDLVNTNEVSRSALPSQFIGELAELPSVSLTTATPETASDLLLEKVITRPLTTQQWQSEERAYLQSLVDKLTLSVSTLNSYLTDPAQFVYDTLLRVPAAKAPRMAFGSAVHKALESLYQPLTQGVKKYPPLPPIQKAFEVALSSELLVDSEYERWLKTGKKSVANYYHHLPIDPPQVIALETNIGYRPNFAYLDDIPLTGKIDRIDWVDQVKKQVRVIDYKTGNPRSIKDITGQTKSAQDQMSVRELALPKMLQGSYKRQLIFYQLLSELAREFPGKVVSTRFEFVQPDKDLSRPPVMRDITITEDEVVELKKLIKAVMQEVRSLAFLDHLGGW